MPNIIDVMIPICIYAYLNTLMSIFVHIYSMVDSIDAIVHHT